MGAVSSGWGGMISKTSESEGAGLTGPRTALSDPTTSQSRARAVSHAAVDKARELGWIGRPRFSS